MQIVPLEKDNSHALKWKCRSCGSTAPPNYVVYGAEVYFDCEHGEDGEIICINFSTPMIANEQQDEYLVCIACNWHESFTYHIDGEDGAILLCEEDWEDWVDDNGE